MVGEPYLGIGGLRGWSGLVSVFVYAVSSVGAAVGLSCWEVAGRGPFTGEVGGEYSNG